MKGITDTIEMDPREAELGPAMSGLTEKQQGFVYAMIEQGGINYRRAAEAAGYSGDPKALGAVGHKLAHDARIQEAIRETGLKMLNAGTLRAVKFVLDLIQDVGAEMKDRLKAAEMVMNRTGLHALTEHKVAMVHSSTSNKEMVEQITLMAKTLGVDPQKLIGGCAVEAEFVEVDEDNIDDIL